MIRKYSRLREKLLSTRAFRDAVRDIIASEGWFELSLSDDQEKRRARPWYSQALATA